MTNKSLIIAEAGVNHNGSLQLAIELVEAAAMAKADIVKFQTFKAAKIATQSAKQADYQVQNTGVVESQFDMLRRLELSYEDHLVLLEKCNNLGIEFLSTAFDAQSLEFLVNVLKVKRLKLPSGEITNAPLVLAHARTGLDIIVSTGMASLADIEQVLAIIAFGYLAPESEEPSLASFMDYYFSEEGKKVLKSKVTVLHCTTEYPAPMLDINLRAMDSLAAAFGLQTGYSDHSEGIVVPIAAVARGATLIEKHFTLDKEMEGPDHKASLEPHELSAMVNAIRSVEDALGDGVKGPRPSELKNRQVARKSLVAEQVIHKGDVFTEDNIAVKRPGGGISPMNFWQYLGMKATKDYLPGDLLD